MADVSNQTLGKIMRGYPVRVYINATISSDGTVAVTATGTLDAATHTVAKEVGYTQEGATLERTMTVTGLPTDQTKDEILNSIDGQEVHMRFTMLQIRDYANLVLLNPGMAAMTGSGFSGIADSAATSITTANVVAIAPTPNDATKFQVMIIYAGYNVAPFSASLAREYNRTPIDIKAVNAGRSDGKTFALYETT